MNAREGDGALTAREREVADCLARGMTDEQIAAALVISPHTVKTHVRNVLRKLDVKSRHQVGDAITPKITPRGIDPPLAGSHGEATPGRTRSATPQSARARPPLSGVTHMTWLTTMIAAVIVTAAGAYQLGRSDGPGSGRADAPQPVAADSVRPAPRQLLVMNTRGEDDVAAAADLLRVAPRGATASAVTVPEPALSDIRKSASAPVLAILEDGVVTLDEVTAATRAAWDCTADGTRDIAGITLEEPAVGDPWHLFGFTVTDASAGSRAHAVYNACNALYYRDVATAWGAGS